MLQSVSSTTLSLLHVVCLNLSNIFFSSFILFFSCVTSVWYFLCLCWRSHCVHSSPKFSEHFYDHYLLLFIKQTTYLHFIKFFFLSFLLFSCLKYVPLFLYFAWLSVCFSMLGETATFLLLKEWPCVRWRILSFNLALGLGCLLNLCDCLNSLIYSW